MTRTHEVLRFTALSLRLALLVVIFPFLIDAIREDPHHGRVAFLPVLLRDATGEGLAEHGHLELQIGGTHQAGIKDVSFRPSRECAPNVLHPTFPGIQEGLLASVPEPLCL
jgi:hypothetical protein